jgi:hypothetical protein
MATKSAVPSHLKAENGSADRHHGKTQSHVVCTEHFPSNTSFPSEAGKGSSSSSIAYGIGAKQWQSIEEATRHTMVKEVVYRLHTTST